MKRIAVGLVAVLTVFGTLIIATSHPAGAASSVTTSVTPKQSDPTPWSVLTPAQTAAINAKLGTDIPVGLDAHDLTAWAKSNLKATQKVGAASLQIGWFNMLLTLSHADVGTALWNGFFAGLAAEYEYICAYVGALAGGIVGAFFAASICIFVLAILGTSVQYVLTAAENDVSYIACPTQAWCGPGSFLSQYCSVPGDCISFGWLRSLGKISGANFLFTWNGILYAWQVNEFSG